MIVLEAYSLTIECFKLFLIIAYVSHFYLISAPLKAVCKDKVLNI